MRLLSKELLFVALFLVFHIGTYQSNAQSVSKIEVLGNLTLESSDSIGGFSGIEYLGGSWKSGIDLIAVSDVSCRSCPVDGRPYYLPFALKHTEETFQYSFTDLSDSNLKMTFLELGVEGSPESIQLHIDSGDSSLIGTNEYGSPDNEYWKKLWKVDLSGKLLDWIAVPFAGAFTRNSGFESLEIMGDKYFSVVERPKKGKDLTTLLKFDPSTSESSQFDYPIDPAFGNGVTALLGIDDQRLISLERSYNAKADQNVCKLFLVELRENDLSKTLFFDLSDHLEVDNLEGMTWGPGLIFNGTDYSRTITLIADNNFNKPEIQINQLIVLGVNLD